jgi:hypothetical protein
MLRAAAARTRREGGGRSLGCARRATRRPTALPVRVYVPGGACETVSCRGPDGTAGAARSPTTEPRRVRVRSARRRVTSACAGRPRRDGRRREERQVGCRSSRPGAVDGPVRARARRAGRDAGVAREPGAEARRDDGGLAARLGEGLGERARRASPGPRFDGSELPVADVERVEAVEPVVDALVTGARREEQASALRPPGRSST